MTDFWWLTSSEKSKYTYVELVHHAPLKKEDNSPYASFMNPCFSLVNSINQWRDRHGNTNVYRSLKSWADESRTDVISGPFIVDIDNECEDLGDALTVARGTVKYVMDSFNIKEGDMRIFFTGHKGFNVEIRPSAFAIMGTLEQQERRAERVRKEIIKKLQEGKDVGGGYLATSQDGKVIFRDPVSGRELSSHELDRRTINLVGEKGTVVDKTHDYVRLHGSLNKWITAQGEMVRRKVELTLNELNNLTIEEILEKSLT